MKRTHLMNAVGAGVLAVASMGTAHAVPISGQGTWERTLEGRDLDGNSATYEAYYDTALDITWLADANVNGWTTWADANAWAAGLDVNGVTGWRLPTNTPINGSSYNTAFSNNATTDQGYADGASWVDGSGNPVSEMGYMYYVTLGNLGFCTPNSPENCSPQPFSGLTNTADFLNVQSNAYWSGSELDLSNAWSFDFYYGEQRGTDIKFGNDKGASKYVWAVRSGDVSAVPIPAAVWLFGSGLIGLLGLAHRKGNRNRRQTTMVLT